MKCPDESDWYHRTPECIRGSTGRREKGDREKLKKGRK